MIKKVKVAQGAYISQDETLLREHGALCHKLIDFLPEHLDLEPRKHRGSRDMGGTGENAIAAPTYCCFLHQCHTGSLTLGPNSGTEEQGSGDAALDEGPADG